MKVIILAAGSGRRLRPYTANRPKCLVEVSGHKLLTSQLSILRSKKEISETIIVGGYKAEMLYSYADKLVVNKRYAQTNMVYSLFSAIDDISGDILISYGDIVYDVSILEQLINFEGAIGVAIDNRWREYWSLRFEDPLKDAETLRIDAESHIVDIGGRPDDLEEIQGQYMGLIRLNAEGAKLFRSYLSKLYKNLETIDDVSGNLYLTDLLMEVVSGGQKVNALIHDYDWIEVDSVSDLLLSETKLRLHRMLSKVTGALN